ncbi:phosphoglycerate mutase family protein-like protein [Polyplosphaeria fusca]|uniref:Phosphoglycerate mutase family protein-like protein n=1 Tax=Polyplosphaeria fusca TaxID=682080 RepID=A0A9P4UXF8_9PLEO|nr:phosphoglycerate mutase family protein-like protein [Polyplosphaeria fusca]
MPPKLSLVRHAEGFHNVDGAVYIRDAVLTEKGISQCRNLRDNFPYHNAVELVLASPMRRTIQTAVLSFGPTLARADVPFLVIPQAQEASDLPCDTGHSLDELQKMLPQILPDDFDVSKINMDAVEDGWNSKTGYWAFEHVALKQRAADLRSWLFRRQEQHILLVTHGAFLHYLTEDWTGDDPNRGTAYLNCEVRQFQFTPSSTENVAHIQETVESQKSRGASVPEHDPHVLDELERVSSKESNA